MSTIRIYQHLICCRQFVELVLTFKDVGSVSWLSSARQPQDLSRVLLSNLGTLGIRDVRLIDELRGELGLLEWVIDGEHDITRSHRIQRTA